MTSEGSRHTNGRARPGHFCLAGRYGCGHRRVQKGSPAARDQPGFRDFPGKSARQGVHGGCRGCRVNPSPTAYRGFCSLQALTTGLLRELSPRIVVLLFAQVGRGRLSAGKGADLGAAPRRCRDDAGYHNGVGVAGPCCHPDRVVVRQYPSHEGREDRGEARQVVASSAGQSITRRPHRGRGSPCTDPHRRRGPAKTRAGRCARGFASAGPEAAPGRARTRSRG
jgi:hypothetical protein